MFNLQGSEIIIVLLLALVVLGPEKLPDAMRKAGKAYAELKKMSSGFQSEFRAAVDEPLREIRETANILRDSADFTKLQAGDRDEKPKSAEMAPVDPGATPADEIPTFDTAAADDGPDLAAESKPAPFSGVSSASPRPMPTPPPPFTGMKETVDAAPDESVTDAGEGGVDTIGEADPTADIPVEQPTPVPTGHGADAGESADPDDEAHTSR